MSETLRSILADVTGLPPEGIEVSLRPSLYHQSNRLYDVWASDRHLIVKEFLKPAEFETAPVREFRSLELLVSLDIAPRPMLYRPFTEPSLGPIVVYEYLEGQMWDRQQPTPEELRQLAELWLAVTEFPTTGLWLSRNSERSFDEIESTLRVAFHDYATWAAAESTAATKAADLCLTLMDAREDVITELTGSVHRPCFCHSDPRFANLIRRPDGRLGWVDWEDAGLLDPAKDLADFVNHPNQEDLLSPDEWLAFLQPCLARRCRSDPGIRRRFQLYLAIFPIYYLATLLGVGIRRATSGGLEAWQVNEMPANEKLRRYLARALAWPESDPTHHLEGLAGIEFFPGA